MISERKIKKLQLKLLKKIYNYQSKTEKAYPSSALYAINITKKYDKHDIDIVINTLLTNQLITKTHDNIEHCFLITEKRYNLQK